MPFLSEEDVQRLNPLVLRLIPRVLWESIPMFNKRLSHEELAIITSDILAIDYTLAATNPLKSWLCSLLGHNSTAKAEDLVRVALEAYIPSVIIFQGAILTQRLDLLDHLYLSPHQITSAISEEDYLIVKLTAGLGYLDSLIKLEKLGRSEPENERAIIIDKMIVYAASERQINILNWLKIRLGQSFLTPWRIRDAMYVAAVKGNIDVLQWFKRNVSHLSRDLDSYWMLQGAAQYGQIDVLNWLKKNIPTLLRYSYPSGNAFIAAAKHGRINVLNWFRENAPRKLQKLIAFHGYNVVLVAALNRDLTVLTWLKEACNDLNTLVINNQLAFFLTTEHIDVLNWFRTEIPSTLKWLVVSRPFTQNVQGALIQAIKTAIVEGDTNVLNWLKDEVPGIIQASLPECAPALSEAAANGHLAVFCWLKAEAPEQLGNLITHNHYQGFHRAAHNKHHILVQFLLEFPDCFHFAQMQHDECYRFPVDLYVTTKMTALRAQRVETIWSNPQAQFDLSNSDEITLCFYILENLIQNLPHDITASSPDDINNILFLLNLRAIKNKLHVLSHVERYTLTQVLLTRDNFNNYLDILQIITQQNRLTYLEGISLGRKLDHELRLLYTLFSPTAVALFLNDNHLNQLPNKGLIELFQSIPRNIKKLHLNLNHLGEKAGADLANAFRCLHSELHVLNLSGNLLHNMSLDDIKKLRNSLLQLQTVILSLSEIEAMSPEQRTALIAIFPNATKITLSNDNGSPVCGKNLLAQANLSRRFGLPYTVPSLLHQCAFFVRKTGIDIDNVPRQLNKLVMAF